MGFEKFFSEMTNTKELYFIMTFLIPFSLFVVGLFRNHTKINDVSISEWFVLAFLLIYSGLIVLVMCLFYGNWGGAEAFGAGVGPY